MGNPGNSYPAPTLPLNGTEQFTLYQQQGGVVKTTTATVQQAFAPAFSLLSGDVTVNLALKATVIGINGTPLGETTPTSGNVLLANGTSFLSEPISGDATISGTGALTVGKINGNPLGSTALTSGAILQSNGSAWVSQVISGDVTFAASGVTTVKANQAGGFPRLDSGNNFTAQNVIGNTVSANLDVIQTHANLVAYTPPSPQSFVNNQRIHRAYYAIPTDQGGLDFLWNSTSTAQPDPGLTVCPVSKQTAVSGEAHGTGAGPAATITTNAVTALMGFVILTSSTTGVANGQLISGTGIPQGTTVASFVANTSITLSQAVVLEVSSGATLECFVPTTFTLSNMSSTKGGIPESVSIAAGLSANIIDDGAGNLLLSGVPIGTISLPTGACVINYLITSGQAITAAYSYASGTGRWLGQNSGLINAAHFGARVNVDSTAAILAALNYAKASLNGSSTISSQVVLNSNALGEFYLTSYTVTVPFGVAFSSQSTLAQANIAFTSSAWQPDLYPAIASPISVTGIKVQGANGIWATSSLATLATNGAINLTLLGDLSLYTTIPPYSAFAPGPVGIASAQTMGGTGSPILTNCATSALKIGLLLDSDNGHAISSDSSWNGAFGVFCNVNTANYEFFRGSITGALAGVLLGDASQDGGTSGFGGQSIFDMTEFDGMPYGFLQVHNAATTASGIGILSTVFINTGIEQIGEAFVRLLPNASFGAEFINVNPPGNPDTFSSEFSLPSEFTMSNGHGTFWAWCGFINGFKWNSLAFGFNSSSGIGWGFSAVSGVLQGNIITQGYLPGNTNNYQNSFSAPMEPHDYSFFGDIGVGLCIVNSSGTLLTNAQLGTRYPSFLHSASRLPEATKDILLYKRGLALDGNLVTPPETAANWIGLTSGNVVTVASYATTVADVSGFPAATTMPPAMVLEVGSNPNVIQINTGTATSFFAELPFISEVIAHPTNVGYRFWAFAPNSATITSRLSVSSANTMYSQNIGLSEASGWVPVWGLGSNSFQNTASGTDSYLDFQIFSGTLGVDEAVFLVGVMCHVNDSCGYNNYPGPNSIAPIGVSQYVNTALPAAANFALGAATFCTNGRNTGEAASAGTGCPVFVKSVSGTNTWCAVWSGVAVTS
jgi:hypothetical protein